MLHLRSSAPASADASRIAPMLAPAKLSAAAVRLALTATLVGALGSPATHAQTRESTPSSRGDAGVTISPAFRHDIDSPSVCCPGGGWVRFGTGTFRLHVDYLHSRRRRNSLGGYPITHEGREASVQRVGLSIAVQQESNLLISWRASHGPRYSLHVLFGLMYRHFANRYCVAFDGPLVRLQPTPWPWEPDDVVFRAELTADERRQCEAQQPRTDHVIWPQAGVGLDVPIGRRFFARAEWRLVLSDFRIGAGIRF